MMTVVFLILFHILGVSFAVFLLDSGTGFVAHFVLPIATIVFRVHVLIFLVPQNLFVGFYISGLIFPDCLFNLKI